MSQFPSLFRASADSLSRLTLPSEIGWMVVDECGVLLSAWVSLLDEFVS
jgi:hypothetical protein